MGHNAHIYYKLFKKGRKVYFSLKQESFNKLAFGSPLRPLKRIQRDRKRERMKIQCGGCEAAEAKVLCCADEAALCLGCDKNIHGANMLVSKHQRVSLSSSSSPAPKCDICQETSGFFFCLEDRALLCRKCDFSIHSMNSYVSRHRRYLLTGVTVGLPDAESSEGSSKLNSAEDTSVRKSIGGEGSAKPQADKPHSDPSPEVNSSTNGEVEGRSLGTTKKQGACETAVSTAFENIMEWQLNEFVGLTDSLEKSSSIPGQLSKDEEKGSAESEWSKILRNAEEELLKDDRWTPLEDFSWTVPQLFPIYPISSAQFPGDAMGGMPLTAGTAAENFSNQQEPVFPERRTRRRCRA